MTMVELIDLPDERVGMESIGGGMTVAGKDHDLAVDLEEDVLQSRIACTGCTHSILLRNLLLLYCNLSQIRLRINPLLDLEKYRSFPFIEFTHLIICLQFVQEGILIASLNGIG